jgi:hypothetical protein
MPSGGGHIINTDQFHLRRISDKRQTARGKGDIGKQPIKVILKVPDIER